MSQKLQRGMGQAGPSNSRDNLHCWFLPDQGTVILITHVTSTPWLLGIWESRGAQAGDKEIFLQNPRMGCCSHPASFHQSHRPALGPWSILANSLRLWCQ